MTTEPRTFGGPAPDPSAGPVATHRTYKVGWLYEVDDNGEHVFVTDDDGNPQPRIVKVPTKVTAAKAADTVAAATRLVHKLRDDLRAFAEDAMEGGELDPTDPRLAHAGVAMTYALLAAVIGDETFNEIDADTEVSPVDFLAFADEVVQTLGLLQLVGPGSAPPGPTAAES